MISTQAKGNCVVVRRGEKEAGGVIRGLRDTNRMRGEAVWKSCRRDRGSPGRAEREAERQDACGGVRFLAEAVLQGRLSFGFDGVRSRRT